MWARDKYFVRVLDTDIWECMFFFFFSIFLFIYINKINQAWGYLFMIWRNSSRKASFMKQIHTYVWGAFINMIYPYIAIYFLIFCKSNKPKKYIFYKSRRSHWELIYYFWRIYRFLENIWILRPLLDEKGSTFLA